MNKTIGCALTACIVAEEVSEEREEGRGRGTHAVDLGASFGGESAEEGGGTGGGEEARGREGGEGGAAVLAESGEHGQESEVWEEGEGRKRMGVEGNRLLAWSLRLPSLELLRVTQSTASECRLLYVPPYELPASQRAPASSRRCPSFPASPPLPPVLPSFSAAKVRSSSSPTPRSS